mgnify:CR=1 FL=1
MPPTRETVNFRVGSERRLHRQFMKAKTAVLTSVLAFVLLCPRICLGGDESRRAEFHEALIGDGDCLETGPLPPPRDRPSDLWLRLRRFKPFVVIGEDLGGFLGCIFNGHLLFWRPQLPIPMC